MFRRARLVLTASYAAALALTLLGIGVATYLLIEDDLNSEIDRSLRLAMDSLDSDNFVSVLASGESINNTGNSDDDDDGHDDDDNHDDDDDHDQQLATLPSDVFYLVVSSEGAVAANPRRVNLDGVDLMNVTRHADEDRTQEVYGERGHYRLWIEPLDDGNYLAVGRSLRLLEHQLKTLRTVFALGGALGLVVSVGSGYWLAGRTLGPIRRAMESQRQFVSDASHELRTPIAVAKANNALLLDDPEAPIEEHLEQAEAVAAELDHLGVLVGDLTTLARADEGRTNLLIERVDLGELATEVVRDMGALADVLGVNLKADIEPVPMRGDRARLRQLIVILVDNSLKYASERGNVSLRCGIDGSRAQLTVSDDGIGISPVDQRRIFERFYRADAERTRSKGGTGLGLAIGKWITESHGGRISVESQPNQGTTFRVRLPLG